MGCAYPTYYHVNVVCRGDRLHWTKYTSRLKVGWPRYFPDRSIIWIYCYLIPEFLLDPALLATHAYAAAPDQRFFNPAYLLDIVSIMREWPSFKLLNFTFFMIFQDKKNDFIISDPKQSIIKQVKCTITIKGHHKWCQAKIKFRDVSFGIAGSPRWK